MRLSYILCLFVCACVAEPATPDADVETPAYDAVQDGIRSAEPTFCPSGVITVQLTPQPGGCNLTQDEVFSFGVIATPTGVIVDDTVTVQGTVYHTSTECVIDAYRIGQAEGAAVDLLHVNLRFGSTGPHSGIASLRRAYNQLSGCFHPFTVTVVE